MSTPSVRLTLDNASAHYQPDERLTGKFLVDGTKPWAVRAAELSVVWYTAGQGEEDFSVHHFDRLVDEPGRPLDLRVPRRFMTVLPQSPLSYDGRIVKVCWCVRLRLTLLQGQESLTEVAFRLGDVRPSGEFAMDASDEIDPEKIEPVGGENAHG